jgi:hypothetical protein
MTVETSRVQQEGYKLKYQEKNINLGIDKHLHSRAKKQ